MSVHAEAEPTISADPAMRPEDCSPPGMAAAPDTNRLIASLLRDLAAVQASTQRRWGYKRAASTILDLPEPIESYLQADGTLRKIPNIGPSSTRVILEVLCGDRCRPRAPRRGATIARGQHVAARQAPGVAEVTIGLNASDRV